MSEHTDIPSAYRSALNSTVEVISCSSPEVGALIEACVVADASHPKHTDYWGSFGNKAWGVRVNKNPEYNGPSSLPLQI